MVATGSVVSRAYIYLNLCTHDFEQRHLATALYKLRGNSQQTVAAEGGIDTQ